MEREGISVFIILISIEFIVSGEPSPLHQYSKPNFFYWVLYLWCTLSNIVIKDDLIKQGRRRVMSALFY
ncbi:hypothetical protein KQI42_05025 [Tissierella sp. MSJ-40]|uniref:Uncharacterized protein n=1 Tax=Tissierella simiarum TaxID=2841534 RepID=A0ABS6E384_9FIRM|nr:hypothetical protein [Tissierella simiarum]MBU5437360.1 hypothetical protein [Tissierella simiarum]